MCCSSLVCKKGIFLDCIICFLITCSLYSGRADCFHKLQHKVDTETANTPEAFHCGCRAFRSGTANNCVDLGNIFTEKSVFSFPICLAYYGWAINPWISFAASPTSIPRTGSYHCCTFRTKYQHVHSERMILCEHLHAYSILVMQYFNSSIGMSQKPRSPIKKHFFSSPLHTYAITFCYILAVFTQGMV